MVNIDLCSEEVRRRFGVLQNRDPNEMGSFLEGMKVLKKTVFGEGWLSGQHYLALQFGCECELRPDCSKAVPVEKLCFLPIELALLRNVKN